jgi:DNA ligase D-like protein (predicted ligase)
MSVTPARMSPALATLAAHPPAKGDWTYEIKFDGYRMLTRVEEGAARLITRGGYDWSKRMPHLRDSLATLPLDNAWLDGEAVVLDADGRPDFNALQNAFDRHSTANITLFLFDLMWLDGIDRRSEPLGVRRQLLREMLDIVDVPEIRFSEAFNDEPTRILAAARKMKLEGIVGKRIDAPYRAGRSTDWIKLKCAQSQEFVVGGIARGNAGVDSLLLGIFDDQSGFRYVGSVPPYFKSRQASAFLDRAIPQESPPFQLPPAIDPGREYLWLAPTIVVEVSFLEWTRSGELRHAVFRGLCEDKLAREVKDESSFNLERDT